MNLRKLKLISKTVIIFITCEFLYNIMLTSLPFLTNLLIESLINDETNLMIFLLIIECVLVIFSALLYLTSNILSGKIRYEIEFKLKAAFLQNKKNDPVDKFSKSVFKNNYLYNSEKLVVDYYFKKIDIFIFSFAILMSFIFTALIAWQIAILAFLLNMIIILVIFILKNKNIKLQKNYADNRKAFIKESSEVFDGSSDLHNFNRSEIIDYFINDVNNNYYNKNKMVNKKSIIYSSITTITSIVITAIITLATILISKANIIGTYVVISIIAANTTMNLYMRNVFNDFGKLKSMDKLMEEMNIKYANEEILNVDLFPIRTKSLYIKTRNKILKYPDISIQKNKKYFLVGKNGVGKSILLKAIQGIFKLENGDITYNTHSRVKLNIPTISSKIILLKHEPLIFKGTILENLFVKPEAWEQINTEYNFITRNFVDYKQEASTLSLGQKQMLALLRSFLLGKELIIVDEALAAVSTNNKTEIENYLDQSEKTIIYVSHTTTSFLNWEKITIF